ncbi:hypothetical protein BDK51DRAFT_26651 [Blyttiomyces helicus]|uniref:Uncharacterized protein n=1 Tax=Blyttiomyces helicus TaxID=388810 RepID=A0A4P9W5F6_9FUNG|nr:hypothetical protein BDK51DRAFT_26651 [Blyttiomyces helicus]|eukprot:RKO86553.1 hypothetical protein BDK51DRAFT_26651 [Blyttiomyces helicus]
MTDAGFDHGQRSPAGQPDLPRLAEQQHRFRNFFSSQEMPRGGRADGERVDLSPSVCDLRKNASTDWCRVIGHNRDGRQHDTRVSRTNHQPRPLPPSKSTIKRLYLWEERRGECWRKWIIFRGVVISQTKKPEVCYAHGARTEILLEPKKQRLFREESVIQPEIERLRGRRTWACLCFVDESRLTAVMLKVCPPPSHHSLRGEKEPVLDGGKQLG